MADLRDLESDRLCSDAFADLLLDVRWDHLDFSQRHIIRQGSAALAAALDEIDRLKRLLVLQNHNGEWIPFLHGVITPTYPTEADAWAAVRKAAMK